MLQLLPARVGMKRSPDLMLTGLQVALTHWGEEEEEEEEGRQQKAPTRQT